MPGLFDLLQDSQAQHWLAPGLLSLFLELEVRGKITPDLVGLLQELAESWTSLSPGLGPSLQHQGW